MFSSRPCISEVMVLSAMGTRLVILLLANLWSAGVGVKQSGDRLFQLNNLKRKIVDELFFDQTSSFPLPFFLPFPTKLIPRTRRSPPPIVNRLISVSPVAGRIPNIFLGSVL
ncbi:Uncharacterised protein [Streptococcus suis]|nr:Uncharacterised protein [Streptococcus suis]